MEKIAIAIFLICMVLVVGCRDTATGQTISVAQEEQKGKLITVKEQSIEIHKPTSVPTTVPEDDEGDDMPGNLSNKELIEQLSEEKGLNANESVEPEGETIMILNFRGHPSVLEIEAGTTVTWENKDVYVHKIGIFHVIEGPRLAKGETWSYIFEEPGDYSWFSMSRPKTQGRVIVT